MNWNAIVIIICILLAVFAVWKEITRAHKLRLIWRILATLLALFALACIALPLTYKVDLLKQDKKEAILLTEGFDTDSLSRYSAQKIFTLDKKIKKQFPKSTLLFGLNDLRSDSTITQVRVLGNGLDTEDLMQLDHLPVVFHPTAFKQGITAISWNEKLKAGEELNIQGTYQNTSAGKVTLILQGLSTGLDSVTIGAGLTSQFNLSSTPKSAGKSVYKLLVLAGKDTLQRESIPVQVEPAKPLKVLLLTSSPDFESRFLKNWLSANGYSVAVRSIISKDKLGKEFINLEQLPIDHLSASTLGKFDLLIGDLSVFKTLNSVESAALQQEVTERGLGIIVRADSTLRSNSWLQRDFSLDRLAVKDPAPVSLILQGKTVKSARLNAGLVYIDNQSNSQSLVTDEHAHILAANTLAGSGKLIFTPLNNTFSWVLSGNKTDYASLWSLLITKAARKLPVTEHWSMLSAIPSVSNLIQLQLESASNPSFIKIGDEAIASQQNSGLPFEWQINYWTQTSGWQSAKQDNGHLNSFYVYADADWRGIKALKRRADTKAYISQNTISSNVTKQIHEKVTIAVSKIYFYVLLLIACAFLWLEAKFR
jgi:hypothetical protein